MWLTEVFSAFLRAENHTPVPGFKQWFGSGPRLSTALPHFLVCISILSVVHKMIILYLKVVAAAAAAAAAAAKSLQSCPTLCDPIDGSPPGSPSLGFSRQEHWSGLPFPSPMHETEVAQSCLTLHDPMVSLFLFSFLQNYIVYQCCVIKLGTVLWSTDF